MVLLFFLCSMLLFLKLCGFFMNCNKFDFFSIWVFFYEHSRITGLPGKGEGIFLSPHYHFHPLYRHLEISRAIIADGSPLHKPLVSEGKSLTTKLRWNPSFCFKCFFNNSLEIFFDVY